MNFSSILTIQLISCAFMTGLIWTIQILHYPAFARVKESEFNHFHAHHSRNITYIVGPMMLIEMGTAILGILQSTYSLILWSNFILILMNWVFTFFVSVPLHNQLSKGYDLKVIRRLVMTNWIRTLFWSTRLLLLGYFFIQTIK
jgi:hypothetical protein